MAKFTNALVTFAFKADQSADDQALDKRVFVSMEGGVVRTHGIEPDIYRARILAPEWAKFDNKPTRTGTLEFWGEQIPILDAAGVTPPASSPDEEAKPDVSLAGLRIVDAEPIEFGRISGQAEDQVIEWRVFIADAREKWIAPRGGRLAYGVLNSDEERQVIDDSEPESDGFDYEMKDLIQLCLKAMSIEDTPIPSDVNDTAPPLNLTWLGNHAPTELNLLLDHCGATIFPLADGKFKIELRGEGELPELPAARKLPEIELKGIDRIGGGVVITSAPATTVQTQTIVGLNETAWTLVAQDENGVWRALENHPDLEFYTPTITAISDDFRRVPEERRERFRSQAFRCIALDPILYPGRVLREVFETDRLTSIKALAKIARRSAGTWSNTSEKVQINVTQIHAGGILQLNERLTQVSRDGVLEADFFVAAIGQDDLSVRCSVEKYEDGVPEFFTAGWRAEVGQPDLVSLNDNEVANVLDGNGDYHITNREGLRLREVDGDSVNRADLRAQAKQIASRFLKTAADSQRTISITGYFSIELSGIVNELKFDQHNLLTTIHANGWNAPRFRSSSNFRPGPSRADRIQSDRMRHGETGSVQPSVVVDGASSNPTYAPQVIRLVVTSVGENHLACRASDDDSDSPSTVYVAKATQFRKSENASFTWGAGNQTRSKDGEEHTVDPTYADAEIYAVEVANGTGVELDGEDLPLIELAQGRAWVLDCSEESS